MRMEIGGERMIWLRVGKIIVAIYIWWEAFKAANRQDIAHTIYFSMVVIVLSISMFWV